MFNISEKRLKEIVSEAITKVVSQPEWHGDFIDISKFDPEILKQQYRDLRLVPTPVSFGAKLYDVVPLKEAYGDIQAPDDVVEDLRKKYQLPPDYVRKVENHNKIFIYVVIANLGDNDELIKNDMDKLGYYNSRNKKQECLGMCFLIMQFEPSCQLLDDETENVKSKYPALFHWTPSYNVKNILSNGLIPSHKNEMFNYPNRTYLMRYDSNSDEFNFLGLQLCVNNKDKQNDGNYSLLKIVTAGLDDSIRFYFDSNSSVGVFTEQRIPPEYITEVFKTKFPKNYKF